MNTDTTGSYGTSSPGTAEPVLNEAKHAVDDVAKEAKNVAREAQAKMNEMAAGATEQAKSFAEENKGKVASQVSALRSAIDRAADELETSEQSAFAGYARDLSKGLDSISTSLRDRGVDELIDDLQQFARRQPAAFLGIAALAGFAASRFAKASAHRTSQANARYGTQPAPGMGSGASRGYGMGQSQTSGSPSDSYSSMASSSSSYPDGEGEKRGEFNQGLGSSSDAASWRSGSSYPQTERGH